MQVRMLNCAQMQWYHPTTITTTMCSNKHSRRGVKYPVFMQKRKGCLKLE